MVAGLTSCVLVAAETDARPCWHLPDRDVKGRAPDTGVSCFARFVPVAFGFLTTFFRLGCGERAPAWTRKLDLFFHKILDLDTKPMIFVRSTELSPECHFIRNVRTFLAKLVEDRRMMRIPTNGTVEPERTTSDMGTVLIVEDDPRMQKVLTRMFLEENFQAMVAGDGRAGLDMYFRHRPTVVVLDLILPKVSGKEVCKHLKAAANDTPVIVLSAIAEVMDKVLLLELGADDYVTKPFSPRELMARVQAAIRRRKKPVLADVYRFGDCEIDFLKMTARRGRTLIALTAHEFKLMRFFTEHAERVLSREELLNEVWGYNFYPTTRTVDNQILKLRQKLEMDAANPRHLQTIYGAGYKFIP